MTDDETERLRQRVVDLEREEQTWRSRAIDKTTVLEALSIGANQCFVSSEFAPAIIELMREGKIKIVPSLPAAEKRYSIERIGDVVVKVEHTGHTAPAPEAERGAAELSLNQISIIVRLVNDYMIQNNIVYGKSDVHTDLIDALSRMKQRALDATSATDVTEGES